jgi:hypothetical protein
LFLLIRFVSYKPQIVMYSFLMQFANQCLLMGEWSPLTLSASVERFVVIPTI